MKLQIALDVTSIEKAVEIAEKVCGFCDILEAGTPLIKAEGLAVVKTLKTKFPDKEIFADMKTADAGELETRIAYEAGASYTSVLACSSDKTIQDSILSSKNTGIKVVFDLLGTLDKIKRTKELAGLGAEYIHVHCGLDEQAMGKSPMADILEINKNVNVKLTVAGGINRLNLDKYLEISNLEIIMIGQSITGNENPAEEARWFYDKISHQERQKI